MSEFDPIIGEANVEMSKTLICGAVFDFVLHLANRPQPMVIGVDYSDERLVEALKEWAAIRNLDLSKVSLQIWRAACASGKFKHTGNSDASSQ